MRKLTGPVVISFSALLTFAGVTFAQRGGADWTTAGSDAQRSHWLRTDPKISVPALQKPGFAFIWKIKFQNEPRQMNSLTPVATLGGYIGYRGFRSLGFMGGSADKIFAVDTDLGRVEWTKSFTGGTSGGGTAACPGGLTANVARPTMAAFPGGGGGGRGGGGRGGAAKSGVGGPGEGAVQVSEAEQRAAQAANDPNAGRGRRGQQPPANTPGRGPAAPNPFARQAQYLYAISSDGSLHAMYVSNGEEPNPPSKFLPAGANAMGLIIVNNVAYVATAQGCGGAPDGVWALDTASKEVTSWKSPSGAVVGVGPVVGPDDTVYVATEGGDLVALEPKTLKMKSSYKAAGFSSSPVMFEMGDKTMLAAATTDNQVLVFDAASLSSPAAKGSGSAKSLATWQSADGTHWLLGSSPNGVSAWKVGPAGLQEGWTAKVNAPLTPMIVNGVVFALASGEGMGGQRATHATLYAYDGTTGKELWNSGNTITSYVHSGQLSGASTQLYLGTHDGTMYAFGFPIEH